MIKPTIHEQIIQLLLSTNSIFQNLSANDRKSTAGREAPPETKADKQVALHLIAGLSKIVPEDNIIIEDGDSVIRTDGKSTWVVDPIDGTIPFMYHIPSYMISIYEYNAGKVQSAFAFDPSSGDIFYSDGIRSYRNDEPVEVSTHDSLVEARIAISGHTIETLPSLYSTLREAGAYIILQEGLIFRSTLVACGYVDATIQIGLRKFESGTVYSLVTNAGGQVKSSTQPHINILETSPNVVISNPNLNSNLASILKNIAEGNAQ